MTRAYFADTVLDKSGAGVSGASVRVESPGTDTLISDSLYSVASGGSPVTNPLTTGGTGAFFFYLDTAQTVELSISHSGKTTKQLSVSVVTGPTWNMPGEGRGDSVGRDANNWARFRGRVNAGLYDVTYSGTTNDATYLQAALDAQTSP